MHANHFLFAGMLFLVAAGIHWLQGTLVSPATLAVYGGGLLVFGALKLLADRRRPS
jgi:hypothetical protein